jgi:heme A synthase
MDKTARSDTFTKYAWFVLIFNLAVILWGVFLRASLSGDGCGQHWLTCNGEVIPETPQFKTVIEFTHRVSTGIVFFIVLGLAVWAWRRFGKGSAVAKTALASFLLIIAEALIGAGLVLTGNTAGNWTSTRPFWMMAHLITTFSLLAVLSLTVWFARGGRPFRLRGDNKVLLLLGAAVLGIFLVGASGSLAALSTMLFPSETLVEGFTKDFASASHLLLKLRPAHPIIAVLTGIYLIFLAGWLKAKAAGGAGVKRWSDTLSILVLMQLGLGAATLLMLSPIVMQLLHLLLADLVWIAFVLMAAAFLSPDRATAEDIP